MVSRFRAFKFQATTKEDQVKFDPKVHPLHRTAVGKLVWMSQLRDDTKHPIKELPRSLSHPQEPDTENLKHLLKCVNQTL